MQQQQQEKSTVIGNVMTSAFSTLLEKATTTLDTLSVISVGFSGYVYSTDGETLVVVACIAGAVCFQLIGTVKK